MAAKGRSRSHWGIWVFAWWVICLAAAVVVALPLIYQLRYADRVYEGVYASGIALGGMTLDEATNVIRSELRLPSADMPVTNTRPGSSPMRTTRSDDFRVVTR